MEQKIKQIQDSLKANVHFHLEHSENYDKSPWTASLVTDHNDFPYWISYHGNTLGEAVQKLIEFLNGERPDHARKPRLPHAFKTEQPNPDRMGQRCVAGRAQNKEAPNP